MDTANPLNRTQEVTNTQNPQDTDAASNGADFQDAANSDALRQEAENLSVQANGDPIEGSAQAAAADSSAWLWGLGAVIIAAVIIYAVVRILREESEYDKFEASAAPKKSAAKSAKKKSAAKSKKRSAVRKKSAKRR